jgi:hypothetical protein
MKVGSAAPDSIGVNATVGRNCRKRSSAAEKSGTYVSRS